MAPPHHENPQKSFASPAAEVPAGSRKRREREGAIATPTTTHSLSPPTNDIRVLEKA